jgi:hypothetical protein
MATEDDVSKLGGEMYRNWEKAMTTWWDHVLESPAFVKSMGDGLGQASTARKAWTQQVDKTMADLHLPSREDVVRIAKIASLLEDRLLGLEDRLLAQADAMASLEKETLKARIDAADALVTVTDRLAAIDARLDRIASALEADKPARARSKA